MFPTLLSTIRFQIWFCTYIFSINEQPLNCNVYEYKPSLCLVWPFHHEAEGNQNIAFLSPYARKPYTLKLPQILRTLEVGGHIHAIMFSQRFIILNSNPKTRCKSFCMPHKFDDPSLLPWFNLTSIPHLFIKEKKIVTVNYEFRQKKKKIEY